MCAGWLSPAARVGWGRGVARRSKRSSLPSTPVLRRRVGWPGPARRPRVRSRPRTQAASPPSPGPTPATRRRWPRSQTRPPVLWIRGDPEALRTPTVAIVGSRAGSAYARDVGRELGSGLARCGVTVVSGLARGVDSAAHRGALAVDGRTVGVLGSGVDIMYPPEHSGLARDVIRRGAARE